jgi:hypothetical protein
MSLISQGIGMQGGGKRFDFRNFIHSLGKENSDSSDDGQSRRQSQTAE